MGVNFSSLRTVFVLIPHRKRVATKSKYKRCHTRAHKYYQVIFQSFQLTVGFIGVDPYIQYNEKKEVVGGAEFDIIDMYAKEYGFTPELRREPTIDISVLEEGGETIIRGNVGSVGFLQF